jgi:hypothetical protein
VTRTRRFFAALVASCCALLAFASVASAQERLYGATGGPTPSNLSLLDPASGAVLQTVGPIGFAITGLAVDPSTRTLYGTTTALDPANPCSLITINKTTGAGTLVGAHGACPPEDAVADITFTPDGTLFGWLEADADDLATINKATGAASIVGDAGISTLGSGLASDSAGTLFFRWTDRQRSAAHGRSRHRRNYAGGLFERDHYRSDRRARVQLRRNAVRGPNRQRPSIEADGADHDRYGLGGDQRPGTLR